MYYKQIESIRFFCILLVLISHWFSGNALIDKLKLGSFAVDMFFVISGFFITTQLIAFKSALVQKRITFQKALLLFYFRRGIRILPLYYLILLTTTLLNKGALQDAFFWNLAHLSNFYFIKTQQWAAQFSQFWSLSVEIQFYLLWPVLLLLIPKPKWKYLFLVLIPFSVVFRWFSFHDFSDHFSVYVHSLSCVDVFVFGAIMALLKYKKPQLFLSLFKKKAMLAITFFVLIIMLYIQVQHWDWAIYNWVFQRTVGGIVFAILLGYSLVGFKGKIGWILESKYLVNLGKMSYGIYLIHNFIPGILLPVKQLHVPVFIEFLIYLSFTILICEILYRFIEYPILKLKKMPKFQIHFQLEKTEVNFLNNNLTVI